MGEGKKASILAFPSNRRLSLQRQMIRIPKLASWLAFALFSLARLPCQGLDSQAAINSVLVVHGSVLSTSLEPLPNVCIEFEITSWEREQARIVWRELQRTSVTSGIFEFTVEPESAFDALAYNEARLRVYSAGGSQPTVIERCTLLADAGSAPAG
ncbi:unnamed protein product, partial [Phaeothamnion confervicola]